MSERDEFEVWFEQSFGPCPNGDPDALRAQARVLIRAAELIERWRARHEAALAAWAERHHRAEKTPSVFGVIDS